MQDYALPQQGMSVSLQAQAHPFCRIMSEASTCLYCKTRLDLDCAAESGVVLVRQVISTELNRVVGDLLQQLLAWQERQKALAPLKLKKRLVSGLRCMPPFLHDILIVSALVSTAAKLLCKQPGYSDMTWSGPMSTPVQPPVHHDAGCGQDSMCWSPRLIRGILLIIDRWLDWAVLSSTWAKSIHLPALLASHCRPADHMQIDLRCV